MWTGLGEQSNCCVEKGQPVCGREREWYRSLLPWSTHLCYIKYVGGNGWWVAVGVAFSTLDIHRWLATVLG